MMAETTDHRWAARTTGRAEPRQNGKGDELEVVESWGLIQRGEWIVHTAHEVRSARSAHERLVDYLMGHRDLRRLVRHVRYANDDRAIAMTNGARIIYQTRTAGGARGMDDISRLVVDEAQWAHVEQLAATMPILLANPNSQTNFAGSAGIADRSNWWWSLRKRALRALAGEDVGEFSYLEHSAEKVELSRDGKVVSTKPDPYDRMMWPQANVAFGAWVEEADLAEELENLGPALFAREHLCVWDPYPGDDDGFLPYDEWAELGIETPTGQRSVSYGLSVAQNGESAALASASRLPSGDLYIDTLDERRGTDWLLDVIVERYGRKKIPIRVNPASAEGAFVRPLVEAGVKVVEVTARQYQQACGEVLDAIKNGTIRHFDQPGLNRAVRAVQRRDVGSQGGWVWTEPSSGVDLSTLKAATLALTGVTAKRPPRIYTLEEV